MAFWKKNRSSERYYLFPGQGGRNYALKQRRLIRWAVVVGLLFGAVLTSVMWWFSNPRR